MDSHQESEEKFIGFRKINPRFLVPEHKELPINLNISKEKCKEILKLLTEKPTKESSENMQKHNKVPLKDKKATSITPFPNVDNQNKKLNQQGIKRPIIDITDDFEEPIMVRQSTRIMPPPPRPPMMKPKVKNDPPSIFKSQVFQVLYGRHKPYKKNKEWSFDGFLSINPDGIKLFYISGSLTARIERTGENIPKFFTTGTRLVIGQWECECFDELDVKEFNTGAYFAPDEPIPD